MSEKDINLSNLPWNFEAFRNFINYQALQKTASVLCLYDKKEIFKSKRLLLEFQGMLNERTGLEWIPNRNISEDILFNVEGNVFRNKARVLTSFFLLDSSKLKTNDFHVTNFCKALGYGYIDEHTFYNYIICNFSYPHEAYEENSKSWKIANISLKPLIFILQILLHLYKHERNQAFLTVNEFAYYAHSTPYHEEVDSIAKAIITGRQNNNQPKRTRSDKVDRKINDIFGFLCMSGYTYYDKNTIALNMIDVHPKEKVYFYEKRGDTNLITNLDILLGNY